MTALAIGLLLGGSAGFVVARLEASAAAADAGPTALMPGPGTPASVSASGEPLPASTVVGTGDDTGESDDGADAVAPEPTAPDATAVLAAARRLERLLDLSGQARRAVVAATRGLAECTSSAATAAKGLRHAIALRQQLLDQLDVIDMEALPEAEQMRLALTEAWSASLEADESYLAWSSNRHAYGDCDTDDPDYLAGNETSVRAVSAKKAFVALWNREVAAPFHLSPRSDGQL